MNMVYLLVTSRIVFTNFPVHLTVLAVSALLGSTISHVFFQSGTRVLSSIVGAYAIVASTEHFLIRYMHNLDYY